MFKKQKLIFIFQGLADFLDNYRMSTSLLQTLNMTRYHINPVLFFSNVTFTREDGTSTFLFRPSVLVKQVERVECIPESEALSNFFTFLMSVGPKNIVLVGLDEDTVGWCFFF